MRSFLALAIALFTASGSAAISEQERADWSERGVFVFGDLVLDFRKHTEQIYPFASVLTDCSTQKYYCAKGNIVQIVLPKQCSDFISSPTWSVRDVSIVKLHEENEVEDMIHPSGSGHLVFLGTPSRPAVVYEYDPAAGVRAIYYDPENKINFVAMAEQGKLTSYRQGMRRGNDTFYPLLTLDKFGACESS